MDFETTEERAARRRHAIFLGASAAVALAILAAAREVLLPFVLAVVIAYLLTPLVAMLEKRRLPRPVAIIVVYLVVLGTLGIFIRLTAPRVGQELALLRRELPVLSATVKDEWVPWVQVKLRQVGLGPQPIAPTDADEEKPAAVVARPLDGGAYEIELQGPIAVSPRERGYVIEPQKKERVEPFDLDRAVADLAQKSILYAQHNVGEIVKFGRNVIAGVSRFFFVFGITLMLAGYMMLTRERIFGFFASLVRPNGRDSFHELLARIDRGLSGVVRGQILICLINGALSAIGFAIVGLKYWPVLAIVATVLSLIPIFGSIASTVPAVALGLTQSPGTALFVLIWVIGIHQLEANLLNPKIMGDAAKIHPVLVVFSLLAGEHFYGVFGALLAVPTMSIAQSVFIHLRKQVQARDPQMAHEPVGSLPPPAP